MEFRIYLNDGSYLTMKITIAWSGKCPFGELSGRGNVRSGKLLFGGMSVGELSVGEISVGEMSGNS